jgi:hypothetical protein
MLNSSSINAAAPQRPYWRRNDRNDRNDRNERYRRGTNDRFRTETQTRTVRRGRAIFRETYEIRYLPNGRTVTRIVNRERVR